jgi:uncharacterized protein (TIGR02996 family)
MDTDPPMTPEQRRELDDRLARLIASVVRFNLGNQQHYLWSEVQDGRAVMMAWHPETPDEIAAATRFYDASHGLGAFARAVRPGRPHPRSADESALVGAIIARRSDDLPYLVYSDWLTEQGSSQGEFIRASVARNHLSADDPARHALDRACDELTAAGAEDWFRPLTEMGLRPEFRRMGQAGEFVPVLWLGPRGVIDSITVDRPGLLPGAADRLFAAAPLLRKLAFEFGHSDPAGLAVVEQLAQIDELGLHGTGLTAEGLAALAGSRHLTRLRTLTVGANSFGDAGVEVLARGLPFARLEALDLSGCGVTGAGLSTLVGRRAAGHLRSLSVGSNPLEAAGLAALSRSRHLAGLTRLDLGSLTLDEEGAAAVAAARFSDGLAELNLSAIQDAGAVAALVSAARYPALRTLSLASVPLGAGGAAAVAASSLRETLRELNLDSAGLDDDGLETLSAGWFPAVSTLDLSRNRIGPRGLAAVAAAESFPNLRSLKLWDCSVGAEAAAVLAGSAAFAGLRHLDLTGNDLGSGGLLALAGSRHLTSLTRLDVDASADDAGRAALVDRFGESVVPLR